MTLYFQRYLLILSESLFSLNYYHKYWLHNSKFNTLTLFFCQGGWEDDETVIEAACREALEEAGVKGILRVGLISHVVI